VNPHFYDEYRVSLGGDHVRAAAVKASSAKAGKSELEIQAKATARELNINESDAMCVVARERPDET
jgi:hypothetical protein